jgi:hypothetical protein
MSETNPAPARTRSTPERFFCPWNRFSPRLASGTPGGLKRASGQILARRAALNFWIVNRLDRRCHCATAIAQHVIHGINVGGKVVRRMIKVKLWDKNAALEKAMKHLGLCEKETPSAARASSSRSCKWSTR